MPGPHPSKRRRGSFLAAVGLAWAATLVVVVAGETRGTASEDVQALLDASGLRKAHATAVHVIRFGELEVGTLRSTVSGGQREEQLAYVVTGELRQPQPMSLEGFVLADWDRRPERFVVELTVAGERHRVQGGLRPRPTGGVLFQAEYVPPRDGPSRRAEWILPEPPVLAPGPLPFPDLSAASDGASGAAQGRREGTVVDPVSGAPTTWRLAAQPARGFVVAGRPREAVRYDLEYGSFTASAWLEATGFPLRLELPLGIVVELVEESR